MNKLTKNALLMNTNDTKEIWVKGYKEEQLEDMPDELINEDGEVKVEIRPLNDGELTEIRSKSMEGLNISREKLGKKNVKKIKQMKAQGASDQEIAAELEKSMDIEVDLNAMQKSGSEADYLTAAYGLSTGDEKWSIEEVKQLPPGVPKQIASEVRAISEFYTRNKKDEEDLKSFRGE